MKKVKFIFLVLFLVSGMLNVCAQGQHGNVFSISEKLKEQLKNICPVLIRGSLGE